MARIAALGPLALVTLLAAASPAAADVTTATVATPATGAELVVAEGTAVTFAVLGTDAAGREAARGGTVRAAR